MPQCKRFEQRAFSTFRNLPFGHGHWLPRPLFGKNAQIGAFFSDGVHFLLNAM
jgi:hypothetical protein